MSGIGLFVPCLVRSAGSVPSLGDPLLDEDLRFTAARVRANTLSAQAYDLKVFFTVVAKPPREVTVTDVLGFIEAQRAPRRGGNVVRLADGEAGLAASTIKRRLASVSSLFEYLFLRGVCDRNPVPRSLGARPGRPDGRGQGRRRGVPLVRTPRKLPRVLAPSEVTALTGALRTDRDRAMVALIHGGLRRCEVLVEGTVRDLRGTSVWPTAAVQDVAQEVAVLSQRRPRVTSWMLRNPPPVRIDGTAMTGGESFSTPPTLPCWPPSTPNSADGRSFISMTTTPLWMPAKASHT